MEAAEIKRRMHLELTQRKYVDGRRIIEAAVDHALDPGAGLDSYDRLMEATRRYIKRVEGA